MESPCGNIDVESVKHREISRPIIMVDMSARRDEFSIVCGKCLWIMLVWKCVRSRLADVCYNTIGPQIIEPV